MKIVLFVLALCGFAFAQTGGEPTPNVADMLPIFRELDAILEARPVVAEFYAEVEGAKAELAQAQAQIDEGMELLAQGKEALEEQATLIAAAEAEVETRYETFVRALQKMFDSLGIDWVVLGGSGLVFAAFLERWTQALKTILRRLFPNMPHKNSELMTYFFLGSSALGISFAINVLGGIVDPTFADMPPPWNWVLFAVYALIIALLAMGGFSLKMQKAEKARPADPKPAPVRVPAPPNGSGQPAPVNPNLPSGGAFPETFK